MPDNTQKLKKKFFDFLNNHDFESAEKILLEDVYAVEDRMDDISEERYQKIEKHWSAVETGEVINTPLLVLYLISQKVNFTPGSSLIDLGSGHGYPNIVFSVLNPDVEFLGIDLVKEKTDGAKKTAERLGLKNSKFITQDLSDPNFTIPKAKYYYIHNPFNDEVCEEVIHSLLKHPECHVISTNGRETKFLRKLGFKKYLEIQPYKIKVYKMTL